MDATLVLARFVAQSRFDDIDESVRDESVRALVNFVGCALGGALDPAVDVALDAFATTHGPAQATLIGRGDRTDVLSAALIGALAANVLDYDDTHLATLIHPSVPVAAALLPLAEHRGAGGRGVAHAFILGVEVACRAGLALGAGHYQRGWHISATCGVLGAAAACAKLLALDAERTAMALGVAATCASGLGEMLGNESKSLNMGFAARNGVMAALLAASGYSGSPHALEAPRGFLNVLGEQPRIEHLTDGLGTRWALAQVAYKPYPCGVVLHPVIDACLSLRARHAVRARDIAHVELVVHPLVLELAGRREPHNGWEAKLSVYHCAAVALTDGAASVRQFRDQRVRNARVVALRSRVDAIADPALSPEGAKLTLRLHAGRSVENPVGRALGGMSRPMSDVDLSAKFRELASEILATDQAERLLALAWNIRSLADVGALMRTSVPEDELDPAELPGSPLIPR